MIDYSIFYQYEIKPDNLHETTPHDIFVSAFNSSERVRKVFSKIPAIKKTWLVHPEYMYQPNEYPAEGAIVAPLLNNEMSQVNDLIRSLGELKNKTLCIDITGFMRHVLIFLIPKLVAMNVAKVTVIYSEPDSYSNQEATEFSTRTTGIVRTIQGMRPTNNEHASDVLILGVGFDHKLISEVLNSKDQFIVYPILGFPSLSPDMFQQSAVRAARSGAPALDEDWITNRSFAPANNPFATATVISSIVNKLDLAAIKPNLYLSPLSTKVQALGFALYWILEGRSRGAVSMYLPECETYARETSTGLKRIWIYEIELQH
jgi:hypothetical protein